MESNLFPDFKSFSDKGITEFFVDDKKILSNKKLLLEFIEKVRMDAPDLFVSLPVTLDIVTVDICKAAQNIFCSLSLPLDDSFQKNKINGNLPINKKIYSKKTSLLNSFYLVWGFTMEYALTPDDSLKKFRDRLDFAVSLYPNHIDFPQLQKNTKNSIPSTAIFSGPDIAYAENIAFACRTFYSSGRAVSWFNSVLQSLKIKPSSFFSDFSEWQKYSHCDLKSGYSDMNAAQTEIEKMQIAFIEMKCEEKHKQNLFPMIKDIVRLNGALSRVAGEKIESIVETVYSPDDLLGPDSQNLTYLSEVLCMNTYKVSVFAGKEGPDYKIL